MTAYFKAKSIFLLFLTLSLFFPMFTLQAAEFNAMVVPSLMDSDMDGWYKIPPNSCPNIHKATSVLQDQIFNLLIFFRDYSADINDNLYIKYDVQIYDPQGNPTEDKASDLVAYQGPMGNSKALVLNQEYLKIVFTEKYPLGTYIIKVTASDEISGKTFTSEVALDLVPFVNRQYFQSQEEVGLWFMEYYKSPSPAKAISAVQNSIQLDTEWLNDNLNILSFFSNVFRKNKFLWKHVANNFSSFSTDDKKRFLIISAISEDSTLVAKIEGKSELISFYASSRNLELPNTNGKITSPVQLDVLWSEFLSTGKYAPIRKIVSALALKEYEGSIVKIKSGKFDATEELAKKAYLEATYRSAIWSLKSNCKQMPLVFKYCAYLYENENLEADIKNQLGEILHTTQSEMQNEMNPKR